MQQTLERLGEFLASCPPAIPPEAAAVIARVGPEDLVVETSSPLDPARLAAALARDAPQKPGFKPKGFWYAVGPDWLEFDLTSGSRPPRLGFVYRLRRGPEPVLKVSGPGDVEAMGRLGLLLRRDEFTLVDWAAVGAAYAGFELAWFDRAWAEDHGMTWAAMFDAPSGCAWRPGVVEIVGPLT